jgi:hypothetical protein
VRKRWEKLFFKSFGQKEIDFFGKNDILEKKKKFLKLSPFFSEKRSQLFEKIGM